MSILTHKKSGVYAIVNTHNGKRYIGSSLNIRGRWNSHVSLLNKGKHENIHLQRAWLKDGAIHFEFLILEECSKELLVTREQFYLDTLKPEYNILPKAFSAIGLVVSDEVKKRLRIIGLNRRHTKQERQKISEALMGHKHSEETKRKMSLAKKGKANHSQTEETKAKIGAKHKGKVLSKETRKKISLAHIGKKLSVETKEKIRIASSKRTHSAETRARISRANKGQVSWLKGKKRPPFSAEWKQKISQAKKKWWEGKKRAG